MVDKKKKKKHEESLIPGWDTWPPPPDRENEEEKNKKLSERLPRNKSYVAPNEDKIHQDIIEPVFEGKNMQEQDYTRDENEEKDEEEDKK